MRLPYLGFSVLMLSSLVPGFAQNTDLPPTVRVRQYPFYIGLALGTAGQQQHFKSNNPVFEQTSAQRWLAGRISVGYQFSPTVGLETGLVLLPTQQGIEVQSFTYSNGDVGPSSEYYLYLPARLMVRVWQPRPQIALRITGGGGWATRPEGWTGEYSITQVYSDPDWSPAQEFTFTQHIASRKSFTVVELGIRADWQAKQSINLGLDITPQWSLGKPYHESTSTLANSLNPDFIAQGSSVSNLRSVAIYMNARFNLDFRPTYRYRPLPPTGN